MAREVRGQDRVRDVQTNWKIPTEKIAGLANDFFNSLIYINSVRKFPVSLGLKLSLDTTSEVAWNQILAMSIVAMAPCVVVFFVAQKYFVEGIATQGAEGLGAAAGTVACCPARRPPVHTSTSSTWSWTKRRRKPWCGDPWIKLAPKTSSTAPP